MNDSIRKLKRNFKRILTSYRILPQKKHYLELVTAFLSIPMLITLILVNYNNLNAKEKEETAPPPQEKIVIIPTADTGTVAAAATVIDKPTEAPCIEEIGPIGISSPDEGETVSESPVFVEISTNDEYCTQVWSYRINNGRWSSYDDKSIALYDLPEGVISLEIKVKSTVSREEKQLKRNFTYTPSAKPSAGASPTP
jgi:hypothetical protein